MALVGMILAGMSGALVGLVLGFALGRLFAP